MCRVSIIIGSKSDLPIANMAMSTLNKFNVLFDTHIISAHRAPNKLREFVTNSDCDIFIAIAGLSAALPGVIASFTTKPVIGVPVSGKLNIDAILSITQMPSGIPVAAVGLDRGDNAALLAIEIMAISDRDLNLQLIE